LLLMQASRWLEGLALQKPPITGKVLTLDRGLEDTLPYLFALLDVHGDDDSISQLALQKHSCHWGQSRAWS
jgi:hypothetical protein